jgi:D-alanyl-D-alanine carboxypeptidase (penicillin-binding protein 5/6)
MIPLKKSLELKKNILAALPCIAVIVFAAVFHYDYIRDYYEDVLSKSGLEYVDSEKELKKENQRAAENEKEYQKLLQAEEEKNNPADPNSDETQDHQNSTESSVKLPKLHALSALLLDAENNRVLYEKNGYDKMSMASTTKIMTCILALENSNPKDVVKVSAYAARMPDVQLNIRAGEEYYLGDLLYSLMLESHNDVAVAIAEHVGGSVEGFAKMMNDKAKSLGCDHTSFVTPNGLDAPGHYTTARDLAVIASYAIKNEDFIKVTNTTSYSFKELKNGRGHTVSNKNRFLFMMEGAIGVKTGFTGDAGYCFVGAIKRSDRTLISVVLGCGWPPRKNLKWVDTKELMTYGVTNYRSRKISLDTELEPLRVRKGQQNYEPLHMEGNLTILMRDDEKVRIKYELPDYLEAPVKKNSIIGYADHYINDFLFAKVPICAVQDIKELNLPFCIRRMLDLWSCGIIK